MSGQAAFDKPVRPAALCRGVTADNRKVGWSEETELNGVEERDKMSVEEGNEIDGEEELAAPDWRVRAGPRNKPTQKGGRGARSNRRTVQRLVHTLHDGQSTHPSHRHQTKE